MKHMTYEAFKICIERDLQKAFPDYNVNPVIVHKINVDKSGIILTKGNSFTPSLTFYLGTSYEMYLDGLSYSSVLNKIVTTFKDALQNPPEFSDTVFNDFIENCEDYIYAKVINASTNKEMLKEIPHMLYKDLAIVYYIKFPKEFTGPDATASTLINFKTLASLPIDLEHLHSTAMENTFKENNFQMFSMSHLVAEMILEDLIDDELFPGIKPNWNFNQNELLSTFEDTLENDFYCVTSKDKHLGAIAIVNEDLLFQISQKLDSNFLVIPSSIHEILVFRLDTNLSEKELKENIKEITNMVYEVNNNALAPEDFLSNNVYYYNQKIKSLETIKGMEPPRIQKL